jgi:hypothetical protein
MWLYVQLKSPLSFCQNEELQLDPAEEVQTPVVLEATLVLTHPSSNVH